MGDVLLLLLLVGCASGGNLGVIVYHIVWQLVANMSDILHCELMIVIGIGFACYRTSCSAPIMSVGDDVYLSVRSISSGDALALLGSLGGTGS